MKKSITQTLLMWTRYAFSGLFMICLLNSSLLAEKVAAQSVDQVRISLKLTNATLEQTFSQIEKLTEFTFAFNKDQFSSYNKVNLRVENESLRNVLLEISRQSNLAFRQVNQRILVRALDKPRNTPLQERISVEPTSLITGKVTELDSGEPLPGVNILVKNTALGTVSDIDGTYRIEVPEENNTLIFSFIGYAQQEININGRSSIDVVMQPSGRELDEIVVIGYGELERRDLTGAQFSVSSEDIEGHPVYNFAQVLQGRSPGVTISNTSGSPGQPPRIRIRGSNSISGNNSPLYVVDGVVSDFNTVNVNDIASVEILKDASATAIYGSRGANGVVLITTKEGTTGKASITAFSNIGFTQLENRYDLLSPLEYANWLNGYYDQDVFTPEELAAFTQGGGTNWQDAVLQNGLVQNHQVSIAGGTDQTRYYVSGNIVDEEGLLINTSNQRYTIRANINTQVSDRLLVDLNVNANQNNRRNAQLAFGGSKEDPIWNSVIWSPTEPIFNPDGTYNQNDTYGSLLKNPYMYATESEQDDRLQRLTMNTNLNYQLTDNLSLKVIAGFNKSANESAVFENTLIDISTGAIRRYTDAFDWQLTGMVNYEGRLGDRHRYSILGAYELYENEVRSFSANARNLAVNSVGYHNLALGESQLASSGYSKWSLMSYFGRLNYNFAEKYFFTGTYRADGSSKFREGNKFGFYPSLSVGWLASEEPFLANVAPLSTLKLRGSWGVTGSQAIDPYATLSTLTFRGYSFASNTLYPGYGPGVAPNPDLRWEETAQVNVGIDVGVLDERVMLSVDYFRKQTTGLLTGKELPLYEGMGRQASALQNLGEIENRGVELNLLLTPITNDNLHYDVNFNLSRIRNEVLDIGDQERISGGRYASGLLNTSPFTIEPGVPLGTFRGYRYLGVWQTDEAALAQEYGNQPGDSRYADTNQDGTFGPDDFQIIGNANPDFSWGWNNTFSYKNFEFNLLLEGIHGQDILNVTYATAASIVNDTRSITLSEATNEWTPETPNNLWPNATSETNVNFMNSSRWIQDGSFIRVRNVSIAYTIPREVARFGEVHLLASGQNLFTFTRYPGFDPEASSTGNRDTDQGLDFGVYPNPRTITLGLSINF